MYTNIENKKSFYTLIFKLALPVTLIQVLNSISSMVDNLMVGHLGMEAIAAVGIINRFTLMFWFTLYGMTSGGSTFIAQFFGKGDDTNIKRIIGITLTFNFIISAIFTFVSFVYPNQIVSFFTKDPLVAKLAREYLYVLSLGYFVYAIVFTYSFNLRTIKHANLALIASLFAQIINITFNYLLIYGKHGFPRWGVGGAAAATVFSKVVEAAIILGVIYYKKYNIAGSFNSLFSFTWNSLKNFAKVAFPSTGIEILRSGGFVVYHSFFGVLGAASIAAYSMITPFEQFFLTFFIGIATAALIIIGSHLGRSENEKAYKYAKEFYFLGVGLAIALGILSFIFANKLISIYGLNPKDAEDAKALIESTNLLRAHGLLLFLRVFNILNYGGVLKSGGDAMYLLFVSIFSLWVVGIPVTYAVTYLFKMPSYAIYIAMYAEELAKVFLIWKRFVSKKWLKNLTHI